MTPERWQEIENLYHAVRERGPAAMDDAEPELRREVERQVLPSLICGRAYAPVKDGIWYIGPVGAGKDLALQFFRFADRSTRVAAPLPTIPSPSTTLSVSPDGKTLLFSVLGTQGSVLEMIEGFR